MEGTPVLDIKPYVPDYDRPLERVSSGSDSGCGDAGVRVAVSGVASGFVRSWLSFLLVQRAA